MAEHGEQIIIKGVTKDGRRFRPSDWAQRLTTAVGSTSVSRRIEFHPGVKMAMINGVNCVVVDKWVEEKDPRIFDFVMNFAKSNNLEMETVEADAVAEEHL